MNGTAFCGKPSSSFCCAASLRLRRRRRDFFSTSYSEWCELVPPWRRPLDWVPHLGSFFKDAVSQSVSCYPGRLSSDSEKELACMHACKNDDLSSVRKRFFKYKQRVIFFFRLPDFVPCYSDWQQEGQQARGDTFIIPRGNQSVLHNLILDIFLKRSSQLPVATLVAGNPENRTDGSHTKCHRLWDFNRQNERRRRRNDMLCKTSLVSFEFFFFLLSLFLILACPIGIATQLS